MRKSVQTSAISIFMVCCFSFVGSSLCAQSEISSVQPILMRGFTTNEIQQDMPISDMILDTDNGLWIAGQTAIWRWSLLTEHMQKIQLIKKKGESLVALGAHRSALLAASDRSLFRITFDPARVVRFKHPNWQQGRTLGINLSKDGLRWLHQDGILDITETEAKLMTPQLSSKIKAKTAVIDKKDSDLIWLFDQKLLIRSKLDKKDIRSHLIHKATHPFIDIQSTKDAVMAATHRAVLRFATNGNLIQAIPVGKQRNLIAMHTSEAIHYFLFDDGLLERADIAKQTKTYFKLPIKNPSNVKKLIGKKSVIALLDGGQPTAYLLRDLNIVK